MNISDCIRYIKLNFINYWTIRDPMGLSSCWYDFILFLIPQKVMQIMSCIWELAKSFTIILWYNANRVHIFHFSILFHSVKIRYDRSWETHLKMRPICGKGRSFLIDIHRLAENLSTLIWRCNSQFSLECAETKSSQSIPIKRNWTFWIPRVSKLPQRILTGICVSNVISSVFHLLIRLRKRPFSKVWKTSKLNWNY